MSGRSKLNGKPFVSVIVPVFNAADTLQRCLEALAAQTYPSECFEIIVVDNGSFDGSWEIINESPFVIGLTEFEKGSYAARNRALAEARGSLIVFTDADCIARENWLDCIVCAMNDPAIDVVLGRRQANTNSPALLLIDIYEAAKEEFVFNGDDGDTYYGYTSNMAVKREVIARYGPFDPVRRGADTIFVRRVVDARTVACVRYCSDIVVAHLELKTVWVYYRKYFLYARNRVRSADQIYCRPLSSSERLRVFWAAVRSNKLSTFKAIQLFLLLAVGVGAWVLGRASGLRTSASARRSLI